MKIEGKLEEYALNRGISLNNLRLLDLCDAEGELHPKLRLYIDKIPKREKQTIARYEKYKQEISSNIQRAIDAVVFIVTGVERNCSSNSVKKEERSILLRDEHPVLTEIYDLLPRQRILIPGTSRIQRGKKISENGLLFYLSCAEVLKGCSVSSLNEFLSNCRHLLRKSIKVICSSSPEKIESLETTIDKMCQKLGIKRPVRRKRIPFDDWPSPLREEMRVLQAVADGKLMDGLVEKLAESDVRIRIHTKIRSPSLTKIEFIVENLLFKYGGGYSTLSVKDMLTTTKTEVIGNDGKKRPVFFSPFLAQIRVAEKARFSEAKRVSYDSSHFQDVVYSLLSLAAYNGIFEYHDIVREAFKFKMDTVTLDQRKAKKKEVIERKGLDSWIEDNWPKYEQILTQGLFKRDKSKRSYTTSGTNMRFVIYYCRLTTMKVMGYRQRQIRDCLHGVNLKLTCDSVEFSYPAEKMKKGIAIHFWGDLENCGRTHSRLIHTLHLFDKHAFPYVQANLAPWSSLNEEMDPRNQFFVYLNRKRKFRRFHPQNNTRFSSLFKRDSYRFLKHPDLQEVAALMIHPHYVRGAAMDTMIEDKGMSTKTASKYFAASERTINSKYKDKSATKDASRDVILMNLELEDLEVRMRRARAQGDTKAPSVIENEARELRQQIDEYQEREKQFHERDKKKDERIASLEKRLDKLQKNVDKHHEELMVAIRKSRSGSGTRKAQSKARSSEPKD